MTAIGCKRVLRTALFASLIVVLCGVGGTSRGEMLTYTLSGTSVGGYLGSTNFTNAGWSMTMTADSATVTSGTFSLGPGGVYKFPYNYLAGNPVVTINTGSSTLSANLIPATVGHTVGLISLQNPFSPTNVNNQFMEWNPVATTPPTPSLGVYSSTLNALDTVGSFGSNQFSNVSDNFNTDQGTLHIGSYNNISGSFTIATPPPAPVPEIDPASLGSALALVAGSLAMLERRFRRKTLIAA